MEIRLLYGNELQCAIYTANQVYEVCVRPYARQEDAAQYYGYVRLENLWQEMSAGRLYLWGAFENGQMCGVGAMQNVGHITMLYVKPQFARRHVGAELVHLCRVYAAQGTCDDLCVACRGVVFLPHRLYFDSGKCGRAELCTAGAAHLVGAADGPGEHRPRNAAGLSGKCGLRNAAGLSGKCGLWNVHTETRGDVSDEESQREENHCACIGGTSVCICSDNRGNSTSYGKRRISAANRMGRNG